MIKLSTIREIFSQAQMKKAIDIARKSSGNYDKAYNEIEKIKKGLGSEHIIANALKKANEGVEQNSDLDESVELDEGVSLSKKGDYEVTADGKSSVGVRISLRYKGKQVVTGVKKDGMFVMAFEPVDGNNKLPNGAKEIKKGKWVHIGFKKADDVISYAKFGDITEAVNVDMRTKGYKEAIARGLLRKEKKEKKSEIEKTLEDANKALTGKNEDMTAGGSAETGEIAGKDMPLKKKLIKRFKEA